MSADAGGITTPKRKMDWIGLRVRTRVELRSGMQIIPAGTVLTVYRSLAGLGLETDPCPHCGIRALVTRVPEASVEIVS